MDLQSHRVMRRRLAHCIDWSKNAGAPIARIILADCPRNRVCHLFATFLVQVCAGMFRYALTITRGQIAEFYRLTSFSGMHIGTLRHTAERVKMQNRGSEGWGFESLQARVVDSPAS